MPPPPLPITYDELAALVVEFRASVTTLREEHGALREEREALCAQVAALRHENSVLRAKLSAFEQPRGGNDAPLGATELLAGGDSGARAPPLATEDVDNESAAEAPKDLEAQNAELREENAKLRRKLNRNSSNSSSPPSKDTGTKKRRKRKKSGKKRGGQPGHVGHGRKKLPDDQIARRISCTLSESCKCGHTGVVGRGFKTSHDVLNLDGNTRFELESARCAKCRARRTAPLPDGVTRSVVGTDLLAGITHMTGLIGVPRRPTQQFFEEVLGKKLSLGTISMREEEASEALEEPRVEAHEAAVAADVKHADETSHRREGRRHTAWVLATTMVTVLFLGLRRGADAFQKVFKGGPKGIVVSDRYVIYERFGLMRQLCLEHLRRNLLGLVDVGGVVGEVGLRCGSALQRVLVAWRDHRSRKIDDAKYHAIIDRCRRRLEVELKRGWMLHPELKTIAYAFIVQPEIVWRFVTDSCVPPTNNQGERDVRSLVVRRKVQLHTWSDRGDRFVERMLSVGGTRRKQKKASSLGWSTDRSDWRTVSPSLVVGRRAP